MAQMSIIGLDEFENRLKSIESGLKGEAERRMLQAGAGVLIRQWQDSIESHGHRLSSKMHDSVGMTDIHHTESGAEISVYPMGTDSHRINNAQKAFILHHGRRPTNRGTKEIKGDQFVSEAERKAKAEIYDVMQKELNEYIAGKE